MMHQLQPGTSRTARQLRIINFRGLVLLDMIDLCYQEFEEHTGRL